MPLMTVDIEKLDTASSWIEGDIEEFEELLKWCGKGEAGDYEHFNLQLAIYHLKEAGDYIQKIKGNYENRMDAKIAKSQVTPVGKELIKIGSGENSYMYNDSPYCGMDVVDAVVDDKPVVDDKELTIIESLITEVLGEYPDRVKAHQNGEKGHLGFLTAQVQIRTSAKANTSTVFELTENRLATL